MTAVYNFDLDMQSRTTVTPALGTDKVIVMRAGVATPVLASDVVALVDTSNFALKNAANTFSTGEQLIQTGAIGNVGLAIKNANGQTANPFEHRPFGSNTPDAYLTAAGVWTGDGSGLTALNASNLVSGTIPSAQLGNALLKTNNLSDLTNLISARTNLQLGTFSVLDNPLNAIGDLMYAGVSGVLSRLAGNTTATKKWLSQTGTGSVSAAPVWSAIDAGDISTGTLPIARGGTNNSSAYTTGSIPYFNGTKLAEDNANLFWDGTNHRLGIGTTGPTQALGLHGNIYLDGFINANSSVSTLVAGDVAANNRILVGKGFTFFANAAVSDANGVFTSPVSYETALGSGNPAVERIRLNINGLIGINRTSPGAQLDVLASGTGVVGAIIDGPASWASDAQQWKFNGTTYASVKPLVDAATNALSTMMTLGHGSTGTPATGFGGSVLLNLNSSTTTNRAASQIDWLWSTATDASRKGRMVLSVYDTAIREGLRIEASGSAGMLGFYGVSAVVRASALTQTYATADRTLSAYTPNDRSGAFTGIGNTSLGADYAQVVDLNTLRVAYENLRALTEDLAQFVNSAVDDLQAYGLEQ